MSTPYVRCPGLVSSLSSSNSHCAEGVKYLPGLTDYEDMLFIGPNDLALSVLGYVPARGDEPEFVDAIERIVAAARKHHKWVGRLSNDGASCKKHLKVFDTVALSSDVRAMQNWYMAELGFARS